MIGAVRTIGLLQAAQERQHGLVIALAGWRVPGHGAAVAGVVQLGQIGLIEIQADPHVEQMLHRGVGIGAVGGLGHQIANGRGWIEDSLILKNACHKRSDGFGNRKHQMRIAAIDARRMPFADQPAVPGQDEAVRLAAGQHFGNRFAPAGDGGACQQVRICR